MAFYEEISTYYDKIFPVSKNTVDFLKNHIGNPPKSVLDVACGTGGYAIELDKLGYSLTAVDLDREMIRKLSEKTKATNSKVVFLQADMLNLYEEFSGAKFGAIYCIGNSLVHLQSLAQIQSFFAGIRQLLDNEGEFIFQIINYDRILTKGITSLPCIVNESVPLSFERYYDYIEETQKIIFKTILSLDNKKLENQVELTPLTYDDAILMLTNAGFSEIDAYGDFKGSKFDKESSYSLVIAASK
ncbi:class I SAM-dependent methyltransferase [Clostridium thermarum]|uniref:class I SAM-dependent methyltransferase n=1 Tax=Clostridium thermarum TaxID=1716543 RepID=UPI001121C128|nr:class I SAM-dependent methyltransferase [Clostridium thermarum]